MIARRLQALAAAVGAASLWLWLPATAADDVVKIDSGLVSGTMTDGVRSFRGIPYAAPPTGARRWRPPQPVEPWQGVRDGSEYGPECPQTQYPEGSVYTRPMRPLSEDCLSLNVWTPVKAGDRQRLPVFVWIHGGALTRGSSTSDVRDGVPLAKKGVVVVSINYRLGVLGYLAHRELTAQDSSADPTNIMKRTSGNYGVLDQLAALRWVQRNVQAFGGDRGRVTIGGESAGSWSVNTLQATPYSAELFHRAIGQSGGRFGAGAFLKIDRNEVLAAETVGANFMKAAGVGSIEALRELPVEKLLAVPGFRTQETIDGLLLPYEIREIFREKRQNRVPVLLGSNANEMTTLNGRANLPKTFEEFKQRIATQYGEMAAAFEQAYGVKSEADIERALLAAGRDTIFSLHMRTWARMNVAAGERAYLYLFSHVPPSPRASELGAFHAAELPYVFNVLKSGDPREAGFVYTDVDQRLADQMSSYWVNFITRGDPNGAGLPKWAPYDIKTEPYLEFGDTIRPGNHLYKAELDFLEKFQSQPRKRSTAGDP
jgi:para-nitrobenzyl esterase